MSKNYDYKQVIVLRKDLNMRKGKMVAQGAHASFAAVMGPKHNNLFGLMWRLLKVLFNREIRGWLAGRFAKITVSVDSEAELFVIYDKAKKAGMVCALIQDAGFTEFGGVPTYTAVAVGPALTEKVNEITGHLKLL